MTYARTGLFVIFTGFSREEWSVLWLLGSKRVHSGKKDKCYGLFLLSQNQLRGIDCSVLLDLFSGFFFFSPLKYLCCFCSEGRYRISYKQAGGVWKLKLRKKAEEKALLEQRKNPYGTNIPGLCG